MREALHYEKAGQGVVRCRLCPRECSIPESKTGVCGVRKNINGTLFSMVFARPCALIVDPIEKKPLYHFMPGNRTLSIATIGCNFFCDFCQNWEISKGDPQSIGDDYPEVVPKQVIERCKKEGCRIISYTYTEPTIFFEYMLEIAKLAKKEGIRNAIVSNGYINEKPLKQLCKHVDAANIDLKSFNDDYYKDVCKGSLNPVLRSLKTLKKAGVWLEITNLVVPGLNDGAEEVEKMCRWIAEELGRDTPLHFSRFFPDYKLKKARPTPFETLERNVQIAKKYLDYVYMGNIAHESNTSCPNCGKILIRRNQLSLIEDKLADGCCPFCGKKIAGVWK